jgi:hypothetical protein
MMVEAAGIELLISTDNIQVIDSKRRQKRKKRYYAGKCVQNVYTDGLFEMERAGVTAASCEAGGLLCLQSNIRDQVRRPVSDVPAFADCARVRADVFLGPLRADLGHAIRGRLLIAAFAVAALKGLKPVLLTMRSSLFSFSLLLSTRAGNRSVLSIALLLFNSDAAIPTSD